jgi:LCP family protein required for cell wall assembly
VLAVDSVVTKRSPGDVVGSMLVEAPQQHFHKDRIAVLLMGIDYNYDSKDQEFSTNARTDTIMAVSLDFPTPDAPRGSIELLSVPRDTDYVSESGHEDKINAVYAGGANPLAAAHASERAVARFLGLPGFDRFITLRIDAAKEVVDAIGGIDVVPDETMNYDDSWGHLHIHFTGGKLYHMNGEQAVSYSRFRHDACSDPCRIKRQQQVMRIVLKKLSSDKLNDLIHINNLIAVVRRNVITDVSDREALSIATALRAVDLKNVKMNQVPFVGDKVLDCCGDVLVADDEAKPNSCVNSSSTRSCRPRPRVPKPWPPSRPASIRLDVLNGSGVPGAARRMADALKQRGFAVASVGNAGGAARSVTEIHVRSGDVLAGQKVSAMLPVKGPSLSADLAAGAKGGTGDGHRRATISPTRRSAKLPRFVERLARARLRSGHRAHRFCGLRDRPALERGAGAGDRDAHGRRAPCGFDRARRANR